MFKKRWLIVISSLCFILSSCSSMGSSVKDPKHEKKWATDAKTFLLADSGELAGSKYDEKKLWEKIQDLPSELTAEKAYRELVYLLAEDYRPLVKELNQFKPEFQISPVKSEMMHKKVQKINLAIVFDSSQAVNRKINNQLKLNLEKMAIQNFATSFPRSSHLTIRGFGGKFQASSSCDKTDIADPNSFNKFQAGGSTALAQGLMDAGEDLAKRRKADKNVIILIAGGTDSCKKDPVSMAKTLHQKEDLKAEIHVIGLGTTPSQSTKLKQVAKAGGGKFILAQSVYDIENTFRDNIYAGWDYYVNSWKVKNVYALNDFQTKINEKIERLVGLNPYKSRFYQLKVKETQHLQKGLELMIAAQKIDPKQASQLNEKIDKRYDLIQNFYYQQYQEKKKFIDQQIQKSSQEIDKMYIKAQKMN
ncbi:vWA domain-containing protein [Thermoflavimicrobium daqui]|uniref:VWFA domain-containing protein n=1 Tax=Thermoflavimicrobium daqui TaxID=2137476 RepID=A0A364K713_9BACL|nr:VWA domain-containing protein [Thermoflavimicrobium daqui]RAL26099.1 hypothetical protein DL897_03600 [Thermoflavimicrobium daqui]